jgi:acyl transferase domain-containing protein/acyl carrier protein
LGFAREEINDDLRFVDMGITSVMAVQLLQAINEAFDLTLPTSVVFECHDFGSLHDYLIATLRERDALRSATPQASAPASSSARRANGFARNEAGAWSRVPTALLAAQRRSELGRSMAPAPHAGAARAPVAVVGLSCRCAGARNKDEFWDAVLNGRDCVRQVTREDWKRFFAEHRSPLEAGVCGAFIEDVDMFDALFFGIAPKEAQTMDPGHRLLLEECHAAIEDAGHSPGSLGSTRVGTFIGSMGGQTVADGSRYSLTGSETSVLSARLAYYLDLKGPALAVNTACSSSLVAIELACTKLNAGDIDVAIAGGVTIYASPVPYLMMENAGMLSATGRCRTFDDGADGIVVGDGVGVVVLKRLEDARRSGDYIYAVIEGIGTNQDGRTAGLTVPSFLAQSELEQSVYERHGIDPDEIEYVECHGTGTKLGDPIEIHALTHAFRKHTQRTQFCAVGSLKPNFGHTTAAAGVLGLIKAVLAVHHGVLPPTIHCERENQHIDFTNSPFYVNKVARPWPVEKGHTRRAAVSSFGFSGTNAHAVVRQADDLRDVPPERKHAREQWLIPLSARNEPRLWQSAGRLLEFIEKRGRLVTPDAEEGENRSGRNGEAGASDSDFLERLAYTLQVGRDPMRHRIAILTDGTADLIRKLERCRVGDVIGDADVVRGDATEGEPLRAMADDPSFAELLQGWVARASPRGLAAYWVNGGRVDWETLYGSCRPTRMPLPTYPFERASYAQSDHGAPSAAIGLRAARASLVPSIGEMPEDELDRLIVKLGQGMSEADVARAAGESADASRAMGNS